MEPGEHGAPGLGEHSVWPTGLQGSRTGDTRCMYIYWIMLTRTPSQTQAIHIQHTHKLKQTYTFIVLLMISMTSNSLTCVLFLFFKYFFIYIFHIDVYLTICLYVCPQAIQNPNDMLLQERAWNSVCPLVIRLKKFYGFSLRLGQCNIQSRHEEAQRGVTFQNYYQKPINPIW